jgi:hypothetical protein
MIFFTGNCRLNFNIFHVSVFVCKHTLKKHAIIIVFLQILCVYLQKSFSEISVYDTDNE